MAQVDEIPQPTRERLEQMGGADLVIGILTAAKQGDLDGAWATVRAALAKLTTPVRSVVIHPGSLVGESSPSSDGDESLRALAYPAFTPGASADPVQSVSGAYRAAIAISENLGARCCTVIASDLGTVTSQWIHSLVRPVLELDFDLVAPCYSHHWLEGLLNRSIVSPLTRALYGRQIQHPLGPDFGFSGRLLHRLAGGDSGARPPGHELSLASIATEAICGGFEICQANVGVRVNPPTDWTNLSSVLAQILGPVFLDIEQNAACWQRIRGSEAMPAFGATVAAGEDTGGAVDTNRLIESFQLGCRNLQEIWGIVFSPTTLLELSRLARLPQDRFRMPDELWARVIYDLALGHRLRTISRDHLLRAMTPLYLAWVASYALELVAADPAAVEQRMEQLAAAFEAGKPYFVSRWRWPDRFNP